MIGDINRRRGLVRDQEMRGSASVIQAHVPLKEMFPEADIPVLQLSMPTLDPRRLFALGERLAPLRERMAALFGVRASDLGPTQVLRYRAGESVGPGATQRGGPGNEPGQRLRAVLGLDLVRSLVVTTSPCAAALSHPAASTTGQTRSGEKMNPTTIGLSAPRCSRACAWWTPWCWAPTPRSRAWASR